MVDMDFSGENKVFNEKRDRQYRYVANLIAASDADVDSNTARCHVYTPEFPDGHIALGVFAILMLAASVSIGFDVAENQGNPAYDGWRLMWWIAVLLSLASAIVLYQSVKYRTWQFWIIATKDKLIIRDARDLLAFGMGRLTIIKREDIIGVGTIRDGPWCRVNLRLEKGMEMNLPTVKYTGIKRHPQQAPEDKCNEITRFIRNWLDS